MNVATDKKWTISKQIPVSLIITLGLQFAGFGWYAASLNARVEANADDLVKMEQTISVIREKNNGIKDKVIRIEERLISNQRLLERISRSLEKRD